MGLLTGSVSSGVQNLFDGPMKVDQYPGTAFTEWKAPETLGSGLLGDGCGVGYRRNAAGNCVPETTTGNGKTCATHGGENKCGTWPNCTKCDPAVVTTVKTCATHGLGNNKCGAWGACKPCNGGGCDEGYIRNAAGDCVPEEPINGCTTAGCAAKYGGSPAQWMCVNGQCQQRESPPDCYGPEDCPEGQRCVNGKCQGGVTLGCNPGEIWAGGECWCPDGSKPPCGGADPCPDPNTHWDSFTGRCLPNQQDSDGCNFGRNPHTDQCNPDPNANLNGILDTSYYGTMATEEFDEDTDLHPATWVDTAAEMAADTAATETAARADADRQRAEDDRQRAEDAAANADRQNRAAEDQRRIADESNAADDKKAAAAAQGRADRAAAKAADAKRKADDARIAAAGAAARAESARQAKADKDEAERQRAAAANAMAAHWAWMEQEKERRAAEEARRIQQSMGILHTSNINTSNIWS